MLTYSQNKFNYGAVEVGFTFDVRSAVYKGSVQILENFIIKKSGGIQVRPPLKILNQYTHSFEKQLFRDRKGARQDTELKVGNFFLIGRVEDETFYRDGNFLYSTKKPNLKISIRELYFSALFLESLRIDHIGDYVIVTCLEKGKTIYVEASETEKILRNIPQSETDYRQKKGQEVEWDNYHDIQDHITCPTLFNDRLWGFNYQGDASQIIASGVGAYYLEKDEKVNDTRSPFTKRASSFKKSATSHNLEAGQEAGGAFSLLEGFDFDVSLYTSKDYVVWSITNGGVLYFANSQGVYSIRPINRNKVYSKSNIKVVKEADMGGVLVDPIIYRNTLFYVGVNSKSIYTLSLEKTDLTASENVDITFFCNHLFKDSKIKRIKIDKNSDIIWVMLYNGRIVTITIDFLSNIVGASTQVFPNHNILDITTSHKDLVTLAIIKKEFSLGNPRVSSDAKSSERSVIWGMAELEREAEKSGDTGKHPYKAKLVTNNLLTDKEESFLYGHEVVIEELGIFLECQHLEKLTQCKVNNRVMKLKENAPRTPHQIARKRIRSPIVCGTELVISLEFASEIDYVIHSIYALVSVENKNL